jgi:hypothetical protein
MVFSSAWAVAGLTAAGAGVGRGDAGAGGALFVTLFVGRARERLAAAPLVALVRGIVAP